MELLEGNDFTMIDDRPTPQIIDHAYSRLKHTCADNQHLIMNVHNNIICLSLWYKTFFWSNERMSVNLFIKKAWIV